MMTYFNKNKVNGLLKVCSSIALAFTFSCSSAVSYGSVTYAGQAYKTVKMGTQTWMAENLNYNASGSKCYDDKPTNCEKYGRLYNWATANEICPPGWHIPSNADWDKLFRYADGTDSTSSPYKSKTAGEYLKAPDMTMLKASDNYGFLALLGGYGSPDNYFEDIGVVSYWWSADENNDHLAYYRTVYFYNENANWNSSDKSNLYSVRCLQN